MPFREFNIHVSHMQVLILIIPEWGRVPLGNYFDEMTFEKTEKVCCFVLIVFWFENQGWYVEHAESTMYQLHILKPTIKFRM